MELQLYTVYVDLEQSSLHHLLVQNAAVCFLTGTRRQGHISTALADLHWLPVHFHIDFKIILLTFKVLNSLAPSYFMELLQFYNPNREMRSSSQMLLVQPRAKLMLRGNQGFAVAAPRL